jgi:hypothetical protein
MQHISPKVASFRPGLWIRWSPQRHQTQRPFLLGLCRLVRQGTMPNSTVRFEGPSLRPRSLCQTCIPVTTVSRDDGTRWSGTWPPCSARSLHRSGMCSGSPDRQRDRRLRTGRMQHDRRWRNARVGVFDTKNRWPYNTVDTPLG